MVSAAPRPSLLLVDNIDSFTFMLADTLRQAGADVQVVRNDAFDIAQAIDAFDAIAVSPGPGRPEEAGLSVSLARACVARAKAYLGVCLGHQALALACGGSVERTAPMHGKIDWIEHDGSDLFQGIASPTPVTRYHSLRVAQAPAPLHATAWGRQGTLMAMAHPDAPIFGVQFHPESIASEAGLSMMRNFLRLATA